LAPEPEQAWELEEEHAGQALGERGEQALEEEQNE